MDAMAEPDAITRHHKRRRLQDLAIVVGLALALLLGACPLSALAVQHRVIAPPSFAVRLNGVEYAAPCPTRGFICDNQMPWYAIWRGDDEPNGTITYRQLFFVYLKPQRRR